MMVRIYLYNDLKGFDRGGKRKKISSNLCTFYYREKSKFCGNYCSRRPPHGHRFNRRCWRHKKLGTYSRSLPPVVLLMISASDRFYNRDLWIRFLEKCDEGGIPIELVLYHEDMLNNTVRNAHNLLSRYRPFPDMYGPVLPLKDSHGGINYAQTYINMLKYGCKIPHAARCIVLTERTIPIRSPAEVYRRAIQSNCHIDISYNVKYGPPPPGLPRGPRGKPYQAVNNLAQGLFTTSFLNMTLPTVPRQCGKFGISLDGGVYRVTDEVLYNKWRSFTGANPSEFWLLNSWLLDNMHKNTIRILKSSHMEAAGTDDKYTVAEFPQWRDNLRRSFVFKSYTKKYQIPYFDKWMKSYYRGLNISGPLSLRKVIRFVRAHKRRALFFRQVELP